MLALKFFKEFVAGPMNTGAVSPSSKALAKVMTREAGVGDASLVVEFGPGTGVFTSAIVEELSADAHFLAMEINPEFVAILQQRYPRVDVVQDSAVNVANYLRKEEVGACESIVCGLPLAAFDDEVQDALLEAALEVLGPGGRFAAFSYVHSPFLPRGRRIRAKLFEGFSRVEKTPVVWGNLPPAFVYCARK